MKRKALAVILIIVIALSVASWLVYNQIGKMQNQVSELHFGLQSNRQNAKSS